jgi:predicted NBD/HSP70 family sugar kinase
VIPQLQHVVVIAVAIHGAAYHGEFGAAGEITIPIKHPLVHAVELGKSYSTLASFTAAFQENAATAQDAMARVALELSPLAIHIVNLLEPGILTIGTDTPILRDAIIDRLRRSVDEHSLPHQAGKTPSSRRPWASRRRPRSCADAAATVSHSQRS